MLNRFPVPETLVGRRIPDALQVVEMTVGMTGLRHMGLPLKK